MSPVSCDLASFTMACQLGTQRSPAIALPSFSPITLEIMRFRVVIDRFACSLPATVDGEREKRDGAAPAKAQDTTDGSISAGALDGSISAGALPSSHVQESDRRQFKFLWFVVMSGFSSLFALPHAVSHVLLFRSHLTVGVCAWGFLKY